MTAVLLIVVTSAVWAPIALSSPALATHGEADTSVNELGDTTIVWRGQIIALENETHPYESGEIVQLRRETGAGTEFVAETVINQDGSLTFDTSGLTQGDYYFVSEGEEETLPSKNGTRETFELVEQEFKISAPSESANGGPEFLTEEEIEIKSNRAHGYPLVISEANGNLSAEQIAAIFPEATVDGDQAVIDAYDGTPVTANFTGVSAGTYSFELSVEDTTAKDRFQLTVNNRTDGKMLLDRDEIEVQRGEIAELTIEFTDARRDGTIVVGNNTTAYSARVRVEADRDVDRVTVLFNTYSVDTGGDRTYRVETPDKATVTVQNETMNESISLQTGSYPVTTTIGTDTRKVDDTATLVVGEVTIDSITPYIAPSDVTYGDPEAIRDAEKSGALTQSHDIATGDTLVYAIDGRSIEGLLAAHGEDSRVGFETAMRQDDLSINITETNESISENESRKIVDIEQSEYQIITDSDRERLYLVMDTDDVVFREDNETVEPRDVYRVNVSLGDARLVQSNNTTEPNASVQTAVTKRRVEFPEETITRPVSGQTVSADTTIAPGTTLTLSVNETELPPQTLQEERATVSPDGTVAAEFDFEVFDDGDRFTLHATDGVNQWYASGRVDAVQPADIRIVDVRLSSKNLSPNESAPITFTLANTGERPGSTPYTLTIQNKTVINDSVAIEPGERKQVTANITVTNQTRESVSYELSTRNDTRTGEWVVEQDEKSRKVRQPNTTNSDIRAAIAVVAFVAVIAIVRSWS